jgi:RNA polymerase sigma-70 factor (ECF subfamily)
MMGQGSVEAPGAVDSPLFATTHWSVVLAAAHQATPEAAAALEQLCRSYWQPLYAYVRRRGYGPEEAQDLTQEFFARFLAKGSFSLADPARGRFRTFLLSSLQSFLTDDWRRAHREKRGGGAFVLPWDTVDAEAWCAEESTHSTSPERAYDEHWAITLLERVLREMQQDYARTGKEQLFIALQDFLWGSEASASYPALAKDLAMTEGSLRVAVHRLRENYRERLRAEVAHTVSDPGEIDGELRHLINMVSGRI